MNRSLDELSASELNAAIDDTNFPKVQNISCSSVTAMSLVTNPIMVDGVSDDQELNQNHTINLTKHVASGEHSDDRNGDSVTNVANVSNGGTTAGFIKRNHPTPLKMVAFKEDSFDLPGTPRTPRTSTTPGRQKEKHFCVVLLIVFTNQYSLMIQWMFSLSNNTLRTVILFSSLSQCIVRKFHDLLIIIFSCVKLKKTIRRSIVLAIGNHLFCTNNNNTNK